MNYSPSLNILDEKKVQITQSEVDDAWNDPNHHKDFLHFLQRASIDSTRIIDLKNPETNKSLSSDDVRYKILNIVK